MQHIRNIAIIAHVDHGKTTLVDCLLKQSGTFRANQHESTEERLMDSMDLEKEKGITIRAKNAAFKYKDYHINIVDTPGHADFGGEVERIMNMIDGVLLVVDAAEGPQAQTRFVLRKALEAGAKPIVVINKIDRENANPKKVLDQVFELFISLNATDEQLDFPFIYCSAKDGYAKTELEHVSGTMEPLFDAIVKHIPPPRAKAGDGFQVLVANLDYSDYLGRIAFGKIMTGKVKVGEAAICLHGHGKITKGKITMIYHFEGMKRIEVQEAHAGDIVGITGFEDVFIGETIADKPERGALPYIPIDPPTIQMEFAVNDGPLGRPGRQTRHRAPHLGTAAKGNPHERRLAHQTDQRPENFRGRAAAAKCRSPFSSSKCGAKATRFWSSRPKCSTKRTPTATCWSRLKSCFWKSRRNSWAPSWKIFPAARPKSRT